MKGRTVSFTLAALALAGSLAAAPLAEARVTLFGGVPAEATIMRAGSTAQKVARVKHVPAVGVIKLRRDIIRPFGMAGFDYVDEIETYKLTAERNASGVSKLRKALRANPVTRAALADHGISINRVVGADVGSNGALRVYVL